MARRFSGYIIWINHDLTNVNTWNPKRNAALPIFLPMSILKKTEAEKLINLLRGEVGEVIQSWVIFKIYSAQAAELQTDNLHEDMNNLRLTMVDLVRSKLRDDIILRLDELSSQGFKTLNFQFASEKFKVHQDEVKEFRKYLKDNHFEFRRNNNIAHKRMSPTWDDIDPKPHIPYPVLTKAIGWAISIMKKFDEKHFGQDYVRLWREERKRRYELEAPANAKYIILPYIAKVR
jgi:hypothetical protein